jgi:hypothetical protein
MMALPISTPTVTLHKTALVHARPRGRIVGAVAATRPITGERTVLPVIREIPGWDRVRLPQRPDDSTGWVSTNHTSAGSTPWMIYVNRAERKARIFHSGRLLRTFSVVVGRPSLPTPAGAFFVAEDIDEGDVVTGPYALATSAYSNVLQEFEGGPGQVALHGRDGLPEPLGTASSHGCIRFANQAITWLAQRVTLGTPIDID